MSQLITSARACYLSKKAQPIKIVPQYLVIPGHPFTKFINSFSIELDDLPSGIETIQITATSAFLVFFSEYRKDDPFERYLYFQKEIPFGVETEIELTSRREHPMRRVFLFAPTTFFYFLHSLFFSKETSSAKEKSKSMICLYDLPARVRAFNDTTVVYFGKRLYFDQSNWDHVFVSEHRVTRYDVQFGDGSKSLPYSHRPESLTEVVQFIVPKANLQQNVFFGIVRTFLCTELALLQSTPTFLIIGLLKGFGWLELVHIELL